MRVISLGWGVQSFTLAAMAALGDIEPVDAAIHADTTHERSATYAFAAKWTPWLEARGVRVVTVQDKSPRIVTDRVGGKIFIPAFTDTPGAKGGQLRRKCTRSWKIAPIRRWLQAHRKQRPSLEFVGPEGERYTATVTERIILLLGISRDEWHRAKDSDVKYIKHVWPLLELNMTRQDCVDYLERHGLENPGKSACVFCPYHNKRAWQEMKRENGDDWRKAVEVDEAIRKVRPPYDLFVHSARIPLVDVDLSTPEDHGQLRLLDDTPCDSGYCFL